MLFSLVTRFRHYSFPSLYGGCNGRIFFQTGAVILIFGLNSYARNRTVPYGYGRLVWNRLVFFAGPREGKIKKTKHWSMVVVRNELYYVGPFKPVGPEAAYVRLAVSRKTVERRGKKRRENRKKYSRRFREHARVKLCRTIFHRAANRSGRPRRTRPRTGQKYSLNHSSPSPIQHNRAGRFSPRVPDPFYYFTIIYEGAYYYCRYRVIM